MIVNSTIYFKLPLASLVLFLVLLFMDQVVYKMQYSSNILTAAIETKSQIVPIRLAHFCQLQSPKIIDKSVN